jgi:hypothetical protein
MMMRDSKVAFCAALLMAAFFVGRDSVADEPATASNHRPVREADLPGLWMVVQFSSFTDDSKLGSYAEPYQWLLFDTSGALRSVTSKEPSDDLAKIKAELEALPFDVHYMCPSQGTVETMRSYGAGASELWRAFYVTRDTVDTSGKVDLREGDIVMTLMGRDRKPVYARQMRKLANVKIDDDGPK